MPIEKSRPRHDVLSQRVNKFNIDLICDRDIDIPKLIELLTDVDVYLSTVKGILNAFDNLESIIKGGTERIR